MKKIIAIAALVIGLPASASATPTYYPSGPQTGVSLSTITSGGWTECYSAPMSTYIGDNAENVLNACHGTYLMMAGSTTGSDTFLALAAATLADATINTGAGSTTQISNGSQWWFSPLWSWGFAGLSDVVTNNQCNTGAAPISMCLHTINGAGGYRINDIQGLNDSVDYQKVFFVANDTTVPEPLTLSLFAAGLAGAVALRRRKKSA